MGLGYEAKCSCKYEVSVEKNWDLETTMYVLLQSCLCATGRKLKYLMSDSGELVLGG